jgi:hypothetical protein
VSNWKTNQKTGKKFPLPTRGTTARLQNGVRIPSETLYFMREAKAAGLKPQIEFWDIERLHPRGLRVCSHPCELCDKNAHNGVCEVCGSPFESQEESKERFDFIVKNLDRMPFPVVYAHNGDVADGNHRVGIYKAKGYKQIPVLAVHGAEGYTGKPDDPVGKFEEVIQRYNSTAGFAGREFGTL